MHCLVLMNNLHSTDFLPESRTAHQIHVVLSKQQILPRSQREGGQAEGGRGLDRGGVQDRGGGGRRSDRRLTMFAVIQLNKLFYVFCGFCRSF